MSLPLQIALSLARRPVRHRYGADPSQVADLHLPSTRSAGRGPYPVAVMLHGGHWQPRYGKLVCRPLALDLVARGWAAWNLEYRRLGAGRGGGGGWPTTFEDVAAGIDALAELEAPLDLSQVVLVGHSAGGQLALWAASRPSLPTGAVGAFPRVAATRVVALAPVTNLVRAGANAVRLVGGPVAEVTDRWAQADPMTAGSPGIPVLVVHPTGDQTVPVARSREYAAATGAELVETAGVHRSPIDPSSPAWAAAAGWLGPG